MFSKRYDKFAGVDFSTDATAISPTRSPDALNIMPDSGGLPEKRIGYRVLHNYPGKINGIFGFEDKVLVHAGDSIYIGEEPIISGLNDGKSAACIFCGKLWILTGEEFLVYDGENISHVRDVATVPQVLSQTDDYLKNGFTYQPFNMLTTARRVGISIPEDGLRGIYIYQKADKSSVRLWYRESGKDIALKPIQECDWDEDEPYLLVELENGIYTQGVGDRVILEYKLLEDREQIIEKCTFLATFDNRLFVGGNPNYPNVDFYSELNDGAYFSDLNYTAIGTADEAPEGTYEENGVGTGGTAILGYSYVGDYLGVHKNGEGEGATLYLRRAEMTDSGTIYPIAEGIAGEGILTPFSCATLVDDPLFLTKSGVYAIAHTDVARERCLQSRSVRVNARLCAESELSGAIACVWRGFYMLFINGKVYLADARQRSYARNISGAFEYEWYYWDNVPATAVLSHKDVLYFGDAEGNFYRFNSDMLNHKGEYLMTAYNDNGEAIRARWSTKMDDDGDFSTKKLLLRRGSGAYVKTYGAGDVSVAARTERDFGNLLNFKKLGLFTFENIDFTNFTFNTHPFSFVPFGRKVKDYRMIQVILENNAVNQCMGIVAIEWQYKKGGFAK